MTIDEIHEQIVQQGLYDLQTPTPRSVVAEQIRRHCAGLDRKLTYEPILFSETADGRFAVHEQKNNSPRRPGSMRRIQRSIEHESVIEKLMKSDPPVFKEIWRVMLFAALLGYRNKKRVSLGKFDSGKGIDARIFDNSPVWPGILHLLALVNDPEPHALSAESEDTRVQLFEEYANGGLQILNETLEAKSFSADAVFAFVHEQLLEPTAQIRDDLADLQL